ncbi:MAG: DUF2279 domain-containing protein [Bacteroidetes bacterium]|nr:DUF2279 domain-containing protein [Bacteroidota bacterium]
MASHTCTVSSLCCLLIALCMYSSGFTQSTVRDSTLTTSDTTVIVRLNCFPDNYTFPYNKKRVRLIAAANVFGYSAAMVGLYSAWYKDYPQSNFHAFNDFPEWQQIDKIGHAYSAYAESKASMELWRWTGIDRKKKIWIGGLSGAFYQTVIEVLDGFSSEWGWSWGDIGANFIGSGMVVAQELAWDEQRIQFKWSFHRKRYNDPELNKRSDKIFGSSSPERFLKDYNGQTYWLSVNLHSFIPQSSLPRWLNIAVGTGAEGMFGATENIGKDKNGSIEFYRPDIKRYRQWYLAPDIDLTKIKTNKKGIKMALMILNIVKFPAPALVLGNGKLKVEWIGF